MDTKRTMTLVTIKPSKLWNDGFSGVATVIERGNDGDYGVVMGVQPHAYQADVWFTPQRVEPFEP